MFFNNNEIVHNRVNKAKICARTTFTVGDSNQGIDVVKAKIYSSRPLIVCTSIIIIHMLKNFFPSYSSALAKTVPVQTINNESLAW
jgi:hypothetical protein